MTTPRRAASLEWEANRATLALAGIRILKQAVVTAAAGVSTGYTLANIQTRRLVCLHLGAGNTDIRISYNTAALATHLPVLPGRYFLIDAGFVKDAAGTQNADIVYFYNETGGSISVYVVEIE